MKNLKNGITAAAIIALSVPFPALESRAQQSQDELAPLIKQYLAAHPEALRDIVKDYVGKHPNLLRDVLDDFAKHQPAPNTAADLKGNTPAPDPSVAIKSNAAALFKSAHQVDLGNPNGDVTMVEFFDYNCGYCKGALPAMLTLLDEDPKLKVVLKEWPILGPGSVEAAHVAVAVRMQDANKYLAFHRKLLGDTGLANKEKGTGRGAERGSRSRAAATRHGER
jgi:protein-disulfide isomerase